MWTLQGLAMDMLFVKGRRKNLVSVGWQDNTLQCEFQGKRRYVYGGVPREVFEKLLRSPYPDNLFRQIVLNKYPYEQVDKPAPQPVEQSDFPF
jgi:hypothetical protein